MQKPPDFESLDQMAEATAAGLSQAAASSAYELFLDKEFRRLAGLELLTQVEQDRIFSKFYRVGDAQTGGTCVGLFIAQGLVSALGGRITVRSGEGRGSSFVVELPARDEEAEE